VPVDDSVSAGGGYVNVHHCPDLTAPAKGPSISTLRVWHGAGHLAGLRREREIIQDLLSRSK